MKTEILFLAGMYLCMQSYATGTGLLFPSVKVVHAEIMEALTVLYVYSQPYRLSELSFPGGRAFVQQFDVQQGQFSEGQLLRPSMV